MNLTSRRARTLLALGSVGAVVAAGATAISAIAAGQTLAFGPTGTSATITNVDPSANANSAGMAYGLKITGAASTDADQVRAQVLTGPTSGSLYVERVTDNGVPATGVIGNTATTTLTAASSTSSATLTVANGNLFVDGHWVALAGATNAATEFVRVASHTATTVVLTGYPAQAHAIGLTVQDVGPIKHAGTAVAVAAIVAGDASAQVTSSAAFAVGDWIQLTGTAGAVATTEYRKVTTIADPTHLGFANASYAHAIGATVVNLGPALIQTAATAAGVVTVTANPTAPLTAGDRVLIGGVNPEYAVVASVAANTSVTFADPLAFAHEDGSPLIERGAAAAGQWMPVPVGGSRAIENYNATIANNDNLYLGAVTPGTYTLRFFKDRNGNGAYDADIDDTTPTFTLNVKDVTAATASTSDDLDFAMAAPGSADLGRTLTLTATPTLTTSDTRGVNGVSGYGALGEAIAAQTWLNYTGTGPVSAAPTFIGTTFRNITATVTGGTSVTTQAMLDINGGTNNGSAAVYYTPTSQLKTTTIADNGTTAVDLGQTDVTGTVAAQPVLEGNSRTVDGTAAATSFTLSGASALNWSGKRVKVYKTGETTEYVKPIQDTTAGGARNLAAALLHSHSAASIADVSNVSVKTGTTAVTYTATVRDTGTKSDDVVLFDLGGTDQASLTTNGTLVDATNYIYSATADSSGVASLTVTDGAGTPAAYTISAASNNQSSAPLTISYGAAAASTFTITNTTAQLYPVVSATSVTLTGTMKDQFGAAFQPAVSAAQTATVTVAKAASSCAATSGGFTSGTAQTAGNAVLTAGTFSYAYTPSTTPAAGQCDVFKYEYSGATTKYGTFNWVSATAPASILMSSLNNSYLTTDGDTTFNDAVTTFPVPAANDYRVADRAANRAATLNAVVKDSGGNALPYASFTLTSPANSGVYFVDQDGVYQSTLTAPATAAGQISADASTAGVTVVFTKTGSTSVTVTAGTATGTTGAFDVIQLGGAGAGDGYAVTAADADAVSGANVTVSGAVTDPFGNAVANETVTLSLTGGGFGAFSTTTTPVTDSTGRWSAILASGSSDAGAITYTATLATPGTAALAGPYLSTTTGLTVPATTLVATGHVTVAAAVADFATLSAPASRSGAGTVTLTGTAKANAAVDVYAKAAGSSAAFGWIGSTTANGTGAWSKVVTISGSTTFIAKAGTGTSAEKTTTVTHPVPASTVTLRATALGSGRVQLAANGGQSKGVTTFYVWTGKKWSALGRYAANSKGDVTKVFKVGKGTKTFRAVYTAPGRTAAAANASVRVR